MRTVRPLAVLFALLFSFLPAQTASADEPGVVLGGYMEAGHKATAVVTGVEGDFSYLWTLDGVETVSRQVPWGVLLPSNEFMLLEDHVGKELVVTVTITPSSGEPVSVSSDGVVVASGTVVMNSPVVSGKPLIGETLTAQANLLYPVEGVNITYQWLRSGHIPIPGATGSTLELTDDMHNQSGIRVEITASKEGWNDSVRRSTTDQNWILPPVIETTGPISLGTPPTAGEVIWYQGWTCCVPTEVETVEWLVDGKVVSRLENGYLTLKAQWVGKSLVARVTRSRPFVPSVTLSTPPQVILPAAAFSDIDVRAPKAVVGWTASLHWLPDTAGYRTSTHWFRVGADGRQTTIPGATGTTYRLTGADVGHRVGAELSVLGSSGEAVSVYKSVMATPVAFNVYTTPGEHTVNGRQWRTTCEKYSQTQRCRTEIVATQVTKVGGRWTQRTGWVFNNLTYLPMSAPNTWGTNLLANTQEWVDSDGRQWRTDCDPATAGYNTCRTYITAHVTQALPLRRGWTYETTKQWVFNNMLYYE